MGSAPVAPTRMRLPPSSPELRPTDSPPRPAPRWTSTTFPSRHTSLNEEPIPDGKPTIPPLVGGLLPRSASPQGLQLLRRQGREHRLQGGQPPPPLPQRARQDRAAPQDRHVRPSPADADHRAQAGPPRGAAPVRARAPAPVGTDWSAGPRGPADRQ